MSTSIIIWLVIAVLLVAFLVVRIIDDHKKGRLETRHKIRKTRQ